MTPGILNVLFIRKTFESNTVKIEDSFCKAILIIDVTATRLSFLISFLHAAIFQNSKAYNCFMNISSKKFKSQEMLTNLLQTIYMRMPSLVFKKISTVFRENNKQCSVFLRLWLIFY